MCVQYSLDPHFQTKVEQGVATTSSPITSKKYESTTNCGTTTTTFLPRTCVLCPTTQSSFMLQ